VTDLTRARRYLWPAALAGSTAAVLVVVALDVPTSTFRSALVLWFFAVCPGMAWARAMGVRDAAMRWTIAIGGSLGVEILLSLAFGYAGVRSPTLLFAVVACATIGGICLELVTALEDRSADVQR
jgi:hypothetical protein